jgi:uncharacterized OsmC-like protein
MYINRSCFILDKPNINISNDVTGHGHGDLNLLLASVAACKANVVHHLLILDLKDDTLGEFLYCYK